PVRRVLQDAARRPVAALAEELSAGLGIRADRVLPDRYSNSGTPRPDSYQPLPHRARRRKERDALLVSEPRPHYRQRIRGEVLADRGFDPLPPQRLLAGARGGAGAERRCRHRRPDLDRVCAVGFSGTPSPVADVARAFSLMQHSFPGPGILRMSSGADPWSARDALVALFCRSIKHLQNENRPAGGPAADGASAPQLLQVSIRH